MNIKCLLLRHKYIYMAHTTNTVTTRYGALLRIRAVVSECVRCNKRKVEHRLLLEGE